MDTRLRLLTVFLSLFFFHFLFFVKFNPSLFLSRTIKLDATESPKKGGSTSLNPWATHDTSEGLADLKQELCPCGAPREFR